MTDVEHDPHRITAAMLRRAGTALYGSSWQMELSRSLGVHNRTLNRWAQGAGRSPRGLADKLVALCADRRALMHTVAQELLAHKARGLDSSKPGA